MMGPCPVVRIVWPDNAEYGGFVEINESDFDASKHQLFVEGDEHEAKKKPGRKRKEVAE